MINYVYAAEGERDYKLHHLNDDRKIMVVSRLFSFSMTKNTFARSTAKKKVLTSRNGETIEALKKQNDKDSRLHETILPFLI